MSAEARTPILSVRGLSTAFGPPGGEVTIIEDINFDLFEGEVLSIVGESGSGKSVTALSIMQLVSSPGRITGGEVLLDGEDILKLPADRMDQVRGNKMAMIFQEPMSALNPVFTIGDQIGESLRIHRRMSRREAKAAAIDLLGMVEIPMARRRVDDYPHQLSGGMRQRVMIAMAIACKPKILIADEPTTALDVTVQAQIFDLLQTLQQEMNLAVMLITHDLGVVAQFAQRVIVMYAGRMVERAEVASLFRAPRHPYTRALLDSVPAYDSPTARLQPIHGSVPSPVDMPPGCRFAPRCAYATEICRTSAPPMTATGDGMGVACHHDLQLQRAG